MCLAVHLLRFSANPFSHLELSRHPYPNEESNEMAFGPLLSTVPSHVPVPRIARCLCSIRFPMTLSLPRTTTGVRVCRSQKSPRRYRYLARSRRQVGSEVAT